jgi:penicillin G amidase
MKNEVDFSRDEEGIVHIESKTREGLMWGMGYAHGIDRALQVLLMRILGQGRGSELLDNSDNMLAVDKFFRKMNWTGRMDGLRDGLPARVLEHLELYAAGLNAALAGKVPWELRTLGVPFEQWTIEDTVTISRMVGYLTLSQSQGEMERLLVEMVQAGVDRPRLEELFPGILGGLDMELVSEVQLGERLIPREDLWATAGVRMMASNNWVVSGDKTASGKPILCNDPHLEVNRLPNVWYSVVLKSDDGYAMGGSMPGAPAILSGRTDTLAWGPTYAFSDAEDSWVEKCKDGKYYREGEGWLPFAVRTEEIKRKNKAAATHVLYENDHGVLDGDPNVEGLYLATRWACSDSGPTTLESIMGILDVDTVEEGMTLLGGLETAWSFVLADTAGNTGFQMSGLVPLRHEGVSGFVPLPGWEPENDWQGFADPMDLPRALNPDSGYFVTTNQDLNEWGKVAPGNMTMGPYRAQRIAQLLEERDDWTPEQMYSVQQDLYSIQAERFLEILRPLLPDTEQGRLVRDWDCKYTVESTAAALFEKIYAGLYDEVFGANGLGLDLVDYVRKETGVFIDFYWNFDRVLLSGESVWFGDHSRDEIFERVAARELKEESGPWGEHQSVVMSHILFGGKVPRLFGFDRGPIVLPGSRATPQQGQVYRSGNRTTTFAPSLRMVTDMATDELRSNMAGGPSDRRFSRWYCSGLEAWIEGRYQTITAERGRRPFP